MRAFISYSHADESIKTQLLKHLSLLQRERLIEIWHDRRIRPGAEIEQEIDKNLETADLILLLVSADFIDSDYCYSVEMKRAVERAENGECVVIPVILRNCEWHSAPFGGLMALPRDGKPVVSWPDLDDAFTDVAKGIRQLVTDKFGNGAGDLMSNIGEEEADYDVVDRPKSANMAIKHEFSDLDRDEFLSDALKYISSYISNSCGELSDRYPYIDCRFSQTDSGFSVKIFKDGSLVSACQVSSGVKFSDDSIVISFGRSANVESGFNEQLLVEDDGTAQYLKPLMGNFVMGAGERKLTFEGAAELIWGRVISPLQGGSDAY